jgi:UDP-galactopyranose mutase
MDKLKGEVLVVGAGFAGAVYARTLADAGIPVQVIDQRPHIAGNAFDEIGPDGIRTHRYGPHLFHTANERVIEWVKRFGPWTSFTHRVKALLPNGDLAPMPINLDTINAVFGTDFSGETEVQAHLNRLALKIANPRNAAEYLNSRIGVELTDLFFRPYTKKMWALDLEDMSSEVIKRIPLRSDREDTYFPTSDTQLMPTQGYASFFQGVLDHPLIKVSLNTPFDRGMIHGFSYCFSSMPIDEYYGFEEGELPYRSLRFHHRSESADALSRPWTSGSLPYSVINFTDTGPFTRETAWHLLPGHILEEKGRRTFTKEEPCDYRDNGMERYYPVKTADGSTDVIYKRYVSRSAKDADHISFIGRCGTYRYLDMDQVINQSLSGAAAWLRLSQRGEVTAA